MAITVQSKPRTTTPAYNPVVWWASSTNVNETNFKFVFDIYDASAVKIAEYRVAPRVGDGYGVLDLSRLLSSKLSPNLDLTNTTYYDATGHYYKYSVEIGEEYNVSYAYTGFVQSDTVTGLEAGYVALTVASHPFVVGDQVNVTETVATNALIPGLHTVVDYDATHIVIDVLYADLISPSSTAGTLIYADNRKSLTRSMSINGNYYVIHAALPFVDRISWLDTDYHMTGASSKFLTNIPDDFRIASSQELLVAYMPQTTAVRRMYFENSDGDTFYKTVTPGSGEWVNLSGVSGASLGTLTVVSGSLPLVKSTTEWYEFTYVDNTNTAVSETKRLYIDTRCAIEDFEILFLDRKGTWSSFNFMLKAQERETVKREIFNKNIDGVDNSGVWEYTTTDKGYSVHSVSLDQSYTLNTNWMSQADNEYFKELVSSAETYLFDGTQYVACVVKDTDTEIVRQRGKKLIKKTITVELSGKDLVNG